MLPEEIAALPLSLEAMFYETQDRIMTDVARRIKKTGEITSTADYQLNRYKILGGTNEMIEREIQRLTEKTDAEVWELYDQVIEKDYTRNAALYEQINGQFFQYGDPETEELQSIVTGIVNQTRGEIRRISRSMGFMLTVNGKPTFTPLAEVYNKYLDAACMDVVTGAFDYNTVCKRVVKEMSQSGIRTIEYESGWTNRAPVAVRRAVVTGVNQVSAKINEKVGRELGTDYYEVTAHAGARPSHAEWQGRVYQYKELEQICGLGTVTGLCGANCRHAYYAFIPGLSTRAYSDEYLKRLKEEDARTETWKGKEYNGYERTQKARAYETAMRAQRAEIKGLKEAGAAKEDIQAAQAKYLGTMDEYKRFCSKMGLKPQMERVYVDGLGRMSGGRIKISKEGGIIISSEASTRRSLKYIAEGRAGLNARRKKILELVPKSGDWKIVKKGYVEIKDLAYLSASEHHEFALWETKNSAIIHHGDLRHCNPDEEMGKLIESKNYKFVAHSHVDGGRLSPSEDDRTTLKYLNQKKSILVSSSGEMMEYTSNKFELP